MVVSPKVSTILESIPGFAADSAGDADKYAMGVQKIGAINSRYTWCLYETSRKSNSRITRR